MACDEQTEMRQCGRLWAHNFFWNSTEKQLDIDLFNSRVMRKKRGKPSCHLVLLLFFWLHPTFSKSSITQFNHTAQFVLSVTLFNLYFCLFRSEFDYISRRCPGCASKTIITNGWMFYKPLTTIGSLGYLVTHLVMDSVTNSVIHYICWHFLWHIWWRM